MEIIDLHTHPDNARHSGSCGDTPGVVRYARRCGITRMVALGDVLRFGARPTEKQVETINDSTCRLVYSYREVLFGFCFISPFLSPAFIRAEVQRCILEGPLRGIKIEYPNAAGGDHDKLMPLAVENNIPVLQHAWDTTSGLDRTLQSDPADVASLARRYPGARIVMAHLTGCGPRGVREVADCPNVWVDTSAAQPFAGAVEDAVAVLGADRLLFGSDGPMRDFAAQLGRVLGARITERQRQQILSLNARKLLGIPAQGRLDYHLSHSLIPSEKFASKEAPRSPRP